MFFDEIRRAVEASPRCELTKVSAALWRAFYAGTVSEEEATALSEAIERKKALPGPQSPARRRYGSRPRSPASMERRRRWAASGALPPSLACRFTLAEQSVLAVVASEALRHGSCTLTIPHLAALAGVCAQTVRNALRAAQGLVRVEQRRVAASRNLPNRVTLVSAEWRSWLRLRGASKRVGATNTQENNKAPSAQRGRTWAAEGQGAGRAALRRDSHRPDGMRSSCMT